MSALHTTRIVWRDIGVRIDYYPNRWNGPVDHIEITSDGRVPLPVTETGYRSNFLPAGTVNHENLIDQVTSWLDEQAETEAWKAYENASKQLSLF